MGSLTGKTAFVSGGTRGIGLAIAKRLAREGADVMVAGSSEANCLAAIKAIAAAFTAAGLETYASADIRTEIWKKLLGNMTMSAVSGVTNLTSSEILRLDPLRKVCFTALDEAISIAHSQNIDLDRGAVVKGLELMTAPGGTGDNKSSLCLDVLARRPSEIEFIYGTPLQLADAAGLAVPTLRSLYGLVKGIEKHYVGVSDRERA